MTTTEVFRNGLLGHGGSSIFPLENLGIMLILAPKSQSASRKSTMPMEIGMTGRPGSPLSSLACVDSNLDFVEDGCSSSRC